jgi:hypothetical protein
MQQRQSYTSHGTEDPRDRERHNAAVAAEISKLERNLRHLGPVSRGRLADVAHADQWREGTFEEAVSEGVRQGRLEWMPFHWLKATKGARL